MGGWVGGLLIEHKLNTEVVRVGGNSVSAKKKPISFAISNAITTTTNQYCSMHFIMPNSDHHGAFIGSQKTLICVIKSDNMMFNDTSVNSVICDVKSVNSMSRNDTAITTFVSTAENTYQLIRPNETQ